MFSLEEKSNGIWRKFFPQVYEKRWCERDGERNVDKEEHCSESTPIKDLSLLWERSQQQPPATIPFGIALAAEDHAPPWGSPCPVAD